MSPEIKFSWFDLVRAYWFLLGKQKFKFIVLTTILTLVFFYSVVPPLLLGKMVDFFADYTKGSSITPFIGYAFVLGVSFSLVSLIRLNLKRFLGNIRSDVAYSIKVMGFEKLLAYSVKWHDGDITGAKVKKIENGIDAFKRMSSILNNQFMSSLTTFSGVVTVFLFLNAKYAVFFFVYVVIFCFILGFFYTKIKKVNEEHKKATEAAGGSYVEGISNILTIKTLGAGDRFKTKIQQKEEATRQLEYKLRFLGNGLWQAFQFYNGLCFLAFFILIGKGVAIGELTTGSIVVFYGYLTNLTGSAGQFMDIFEDLIDAKTSMGRMMSILWGKTDSVFGTKVFPKDWQTITLSQINFSYKSDQDTKTNLVHLDFNITRNEKIGIVGKTGSGKSTLSKILAGLYKIDSGDYLVDDVNFYDISDTEISKHIALVLQDSEMFNLSLRENITLLRQVSPVLFEKAIKIAQLEDVVAKLPQGLDTLIGEKGYHLSGGERQRVGIARAICKDPEIVIFDEATSSLDAKTEKLVHEAIESELDNKTLIVIAHRIQTLENVDRVYVFKDGEIVESGKFSELTKDINSEFSKVYLHKQK